MLLIDHDERYETFSNNFFWCLALDCKTTLTSGPGAEGERSAGSAQKDKVGSTYFWDPESFVAQALQNGQNGYNGGKKVFVSCNF